MATKEVNRAQVVPTMKVRTSLKGDGSWIRRVTDPDEEEGKPRKPELPKKPTGLFSAESSPVTSLASCNPYSPTVTPDVDPLTPEEITKWSLTSSRVRPLAKSYVLSAAKKFEPEELSEAVEESDPPTAESKYKSLGKPVEQPAVQESVNEPAARKSVDAPADQPEAAEPSETTTEEPPASVEEADGELIAQLTAEPTVGPTVEPASEIQSEETAVESVLEPVVKPVDSVSEEPAVRPAAVEAIELVVEPVVAVKPVVEPVATVKPVVEPVATVKPVVEPVATVKPVVEPVAAVKPVVEPVAAVKPVVEPVAAVKPVVEPVAAVKPVVEPVAAVKPVVEPVAAVKPVVEAEAVAEAAVEVVQELSAAIELEEALDVELPAAEVVADDIIAPASEPTPSPCGGQVPSLIQQQEDAEPQHQIVHDFRHTKDGKAICSYCDKSIDGNVKITINYPQIYSHPDCFKCGLCSKALGDMTTSMFVHGRVIHCDGCFIKTM
ncbi:calphotin isoform X2 [Oncorhynchus mykiss]|uniref:calphotin isoform X2 n=1 Tax=Oncorhynchus mykiss TaxID=8022 RepID=UPI0018776E2D|nr:calphotin isoform X2 [Oncorhynchus mykiss]